MICYLASYIFGEFCSWEIIHSIFRTFIHVTLDAIRKTFDDLLVIVSRILLQKLFDLIIVGCIGFDFLL